ncbi:MAG: hypothetical protein ACLQUW_05075 [Desulfobaccales bacterium]
MADIRKNLRDIPTLSGRVDRVSLPYRAYLKISCLEMEKARRTRERFAALKTMDKIDIRLQEIEKEKAALLLMMEQPSGVAAPLMIAKMRGGQKIRY